MKIPVNYKNLSWQERRAVRKQYVLNQKGLCAYCGESLENAPPEEISALRVNKRLFPESFFKWPVHLHHCHRTGMTIGAVHCQCNAVLWQYFGE